MRVITRRQALLTGGSLAALTACGGGRTIVPATQSVPPPPLPHAPPCDPPALALRPEEVVARALDAAKRAGATYADARVMRRRGEYLGTREDHVIAVEASESYGVGVRVLAGGAWGFAAASRLSQVEEAARRAVEIAKANAAIGGTPVELVPVPAYHDAWQTAMNRDPFGVPLDEKVAFLLSLWAEARAVTGVKHGRASVFAVAEWKLFGSTEGSLIEQSITRIAPTFEVTAVDTTAGTFETRRHDIAPMQAGWEYVEGSSLHADARRIGEEAVEKLSAPTIDARKRDLVLAPSHLWLTIHESVGHPTELDRAMGYEANFAGTSFATPDKLGKLQYAAPFVTIYGDKTTRGGLASCGYDDDGVKTQRFDLVKDGRFVGYQTTRDEASWIGETASRGTSYAQDYRSIPFQRMPNVCLAPGAKELKVDDLIAATDDGIYIVGQGSWSIDHQRYNFQFGGQMFYEIKKGKVLRTLRSVAYQSNTLDFWRSCDMLGGASSWELYGSINDGKGEPEQNNPVSHGCPPARFKQVNVFSSQPKKGGA